MLKLNNITLITVDGTESCELSLKALLYSSKDIEFADIKLLAYGDPPFLPEKINFVRIPRLNFEQYSNFIIKNLSDYVDTEFVLLVQADGFVLNPQLWNEEFLRYDYIGAPWKLSSHYNYIRVGNGGFSLRSKKFLEISKNECPTYSFYEDHIVCITHRDIFLRHGIVYAPLEMAMKFSLETPIEECEFDLTKTFGFHGKNEYYEMLKTWEPLEKSRIIPVGDISEIAMGDQKKITIGVWGFYEQQYYNNQIFHTPDAGIGENLLKPINDLYQFGKAHNIEFTTLDLIENHDTIDGYLFFDFPRMDSPYVQKVFATNKPKFLLILESPLIKPDNWLPENHQLFAKIFTYLDSIIDNRKYFKINYCADLPKSINKNLSVKEKLCNTIAGGKYIEHELSLYPERIKAIRWFEENHPEDFDLYGIGWDPQLFPSYKGTVRSKKEVLQKYKFSICYENTKDIPGYITEKIFDCFFAGCVPVYWGANNVTEHIPSGCFIDRRAFQTYADLYNFMKNMPDEEYLNYLNNIESFLNSEAAYPFCTQAFIETITQVCLSETLPKRKEQKVKQSADLFSSSVSSKSNLDKLSFATQEKAVPSVVGFGTQKGLSSIILTAYNKLELTKYCVESILQFTKSPYELILIDNGSTDGTWEYFESIKIFHPDTRVIKCFQNRVVEANANKAISIAKGEYIISVTNDMIVHEDWLENFIQHMESAPDVGMVGPRSNNISGPQFLSADYNSIEEYQSFASSLRKQNRGSNFPVWRMVGMCTITKKSILERIGGFDPDLPTNGRDGGYGFSDDDISLRLILAGYRLLVANDVYIHHFGSATTLSERFTSDLFGTALNINKIKFEKKIRSDPRMKILPNGEIAIQALNLSDPVSVPENLTITYPSICLVQLSENESSNSRYALSEFDTGISSVLTVSRKIFHKWLSDAAKQMKYNYVVAVDEKLDVSVQDINTLIDTAFSYPDIAILVPVNEAGASTHRAAGVRDELIPFADLSVSVLNMKLIQPCINGLTYFSETEDALWFLQRRIRGGGYGIAKTGVITLLYGDQTLSHPYDERILPEKLLEQGKVEEAMKIYLDDPEIDPSFVESMYHLALIEKEKSNFERAKFYLKKILTIDEHHIPALVQLSKIHMVERDTVNVEQYVRAAYFKQPRNPEVQKLIEEYTALLEKTQEDHQELPGTAKRETQKPGSSSSTIDKPQALTTSIIILTSNHPGYIRKCVNSIKKHTPEQHEIIFVPINAAHAQMNDIKKAIRKNKQYKLIETKESINYAQACNKGITESSGEYIILLHDDVIVTEGWLSGMLEHLKSAPDIGIVSPMTINIEGPQRVRDSEFDIRMLSLRGEAEAISASEGIATHHSGARNDGMLKHLEEYARSFREKNRYRRVDSVNLNGFCMGFRSDLLEKIGLMDEQLGFYDFADNDFCQRSALEGHRNIIAGDLFLCAQKNRTLGGIKPDSSVSITKSAKIFYNKWTSLNNSMLQGKKYSILQALSAADELNQKGRRDQASLALLDVLKTAPYEKRLHYALAELLIEDKKFKDALDILERMPKVLKEEATWFEFAGYCKEELSLYEEAEQYADKALALNSASVRALNLKGQIAYKKGLFADAERFYQKALESDRSFGETYANIGALKWNAGNRNEAFSFIEKAFLLSPTVEDNVLNYHSAAVSLSRLEGTEGFLEDAAALNPSSKRLKYTLLDIFLQQEKYHEAMQLIKEALLTFGIEDEGLLIALGIRDKIGPKEILKDVEKDFKKSPLTKGDKGGCKTYNEEKSKKQPPAPPFLRGNLQPSPSPSSLDPGTISLCMIVKNEEKNIGRCLREIDPLVDEMIVVDTGSADRTKDIARAFGAKVYDFAWTNSFSDARNFSLSKASGDWILVLDADEVISPSDHDKLRELVVIPPNPPFPHSGGFAEAKLKGGKKMEALEKGGEEEESIQKGPACRPSGRGLLAYSFVTRNYINSVQIGWVANDGRYFKEEAGTGWLPSEKVRLFPNHLDIRFENPIHELVEPSLGRLGIEFLKCAIPIHHYGKLNTTKENAKGEDYYTLGKLKLSEKGELNGKALYELAVQTTIVQRHEEALDLWKRVIKANYDLPKAYSGMGNVYFSLGRYDDAAKSMEKARALNPDSPDITALYAKCHVYAGNVESAIPALEGLLERNPKYPTALGLLAIAYFCVHKKDKGMECIRKLDETYFDCAMLLSKYAKKFINDKKYDYAISILDGAMASNNTTGETQQLLQEAKEKVHAEVKEKVKAEVEVKGEDKIATSRMLSGLAMTKKESVIASEAKQSPVSISLCMIVKDEEDNIERCLSSIKPAVDEIIVVDTGSTDRTKDKARSFGAKVYDYHWSNSFSDARNYSLSKASGDWILVLDADEVISPSDHDKLRALVVIPPCPPLEKGGQKMEALLKGGKEEEALLKGGKEEETLQKGPACRPSGKVKGGLFAYSFVTRNYLTQTNTIDWTANDGKYKEEAGTGWFPGEKTRLFPNKPAVRFDFPVHERIEPSLVKEGIKIMNCDIPVHHYGKLDQRKAQLRAELYYELAKIKLTQQKSPDVMVLYETALQAAEIGKHDEALEYLQEVIRLKPDFARAYVSMGNNYFNLARYEDALSPYMKALELDPDSIDAALQYALSAVYTGHAETAIAHLEEFLRKNAANIRALALLAAAYFCSEKKDEGIRFLDQLKNMDFDYARHFSGFARTLVKAGRFEYAISLLKALSGIKALDEDISLQLAQYSIIQQLNSLQAKVSIIVIISDNSVKVRECVHSIRKYTPEPHEIIFVQTEPSFKQDYWLQELLKENPNIHVVSGTKERENTSPSPLSPSVLRIDGPPIKGGENDRATPVKEGQQTPAPRYKSIPTLSRRETIPSPLVGEGKGEGGFEHQGKINYAKACNLGINASSGEYIVIIRDNVILTEGWLSGMLECVMNNPDIGIVGPMTINVESPQGVKDSEFDVRMLSLRGEAEAISASEGIATRPSGIRNDRMLKHLDEFARSFRRKNRYRRIPYRKLNNFCILFSRKVHTKTGLFDERFSSSEFAIDDYCLRTVLEGYRNVIAGDVFIHQADDQGSLNLVLSRERTLTHNKNLFADRKPFIDKWSTIDTKGPAREKLIVENALSLAEELGHKGQQDNAVLALSEGIKYVPYEKSLHFALAEFLIENKNINKALEVIEHMPETLKQDPQRLELIGYCKEGMKQYEEAERYADEALSLNSSSPKAWNLKGFIAYEKGLLNDAESYFQKALEYEKSSGETYSNIGALKWKTDKKEEAFDLFEKAFILSPVHEDIVMNYHAVAVTLSQLKRAENIFRDAASAYPLNKKLKYVLADILLQEEKFDEAMNILEESMVTFGIDHDTLSLALGIREKVGPKEIHRDKVKAKVEGENEIATSRMLSGLAMTNKESVIASEAKQSPVSLSVCMIVKNEEKNIATCLKKIGSLVDEMIVVDTGSTDRTKDIAQAFGARIYDFAWKNNFSDARNFSLSKASGEWILALDADEVIAPFDQDLLKELIKKPEFKFTAFSIITRNYVIPVSALAWTANDGSYINEETGTGWYPSEKVRLFPNNPLVQFENPVHEFVETSLSKLGIKIIQIDIPVHHYGKLNREKTLSKGEEYYILGKAKLAQRGEQDFIALYELAMQASELERFEEALELWEKVSEVNPNCAKAFFGMGNSYYRLGNFEEALKNLEKAIKLEPDSPEIKEMVTLYASCSIFTGKPELCVPLLKDTLKKKPGYHMGMVMIAMVYFCLHQQQKGHKYLKTLKKMHFNYENYFYDFVKYLLSSGKSDYAQSLIKAVIETDTTDNRFSIMLTQCQKMIQDRSDHSEKKDEYLNGKSTHS